MAKIKIIVEKTRTGYSAYADKYAAYTTGGNFPQLKRNMLEALNLLFDYQGKKLVKEDGLQFTLDLAQFFEFYRVINAKALSERIGMNQSLLAQYISGIKTPSDAQVNRILKGIRELGRELSKIELVS